MRAVFGLMAHGCSGLAVALLVLAAVAAPVRDARADGGTSPCGDPFLDCVHSRTGHCSPESCMPNPQACDGCGSATHVCAGSSCNSAGTCVLAATPSGGTTCSGGTAACRPLTVGNVCRDCICQNVSGVIPPTACDCN